MMVHCWITITNNGTNRELVGIPGHIFFHPFYTVQHMHPDDMIVCHCLFDVEIYFDNLFSNFV